VVDKPLDEEKSVAESRVSAQMMAAGYLRRDVERGDDISTLEPARGAVELMNEQDSTQARRGRRGSTVP
jgi:hypothetical protein